MPELAPREKVGVQVTVADADTMQDAGVGTPNITKVADERPMQNKQPEPFPLKLNKNRPIRQNIPQDQLQELDTSAEAAKEAQINFNATINSVLADKSIQYDEETLKTDAVFQESARRLSEFLGDQIKPSTEGLFSGSPVDVGTPGEQQAEYGLDLYSELISNLGGVSMDQQRLGGTVPVLSRVIDSEDLDTQLAALYVMEMGDRKEITLTGAGRAVKHMVGDLTNYIGLATMPVLVGKFAARNVIKSSTKKALQEAIKKTVQLKGVAALTSPTAKAAGMGALEGGSLLGVENLMRQYVEVSAGRRDGIDATEIAKSFGLGAAFGGSLVGLTVAIPKAVMASINGAISSREKVTKLYAWFDEEMKKIENEMYSQAGGGTPPTSSNETLKVIHNLTTSNLEFIQKYFDGQIPAPSVAITDVNVPFDSFGEISLYGDKLTIDPRLSSNKVFGADAYAKRIPKAEFAIGKKDFDEFLSKMDNVNNFKYELASNIRDVANGNYSADQMARILSREENAKSSYKKLSGKTKYSEKSAEKWWLSEIKKLQKEPIFNAGPDYYSRKMKPYSVEELVKYLRKHQTNASEGFNYGLPSARALGLRELKSLKAIKDRTTPLVTSSEMDNVKEALSNEYFNLRSEIAQYSNYSSVDDDAFNEIVAGFMNGRVSRALTEDFTAVPEELVSKLSDFGKTLAVAPTQYYEAKLMRAVDISEFKGALVPKGTPKRLTDLLKSKGLKVKIYSDNRQLSEKSFLEANKEWLFMVPPVAFLSGNREFENNNEETK